MNQSPHQSEMEKTTLDSHKASKSPVFFSILAFTAALCLLSMAQKSMIGADPFAIHGFTVPVLFGGLAGLTVGTLLVRNKQGFLNRIAQEQHASRQLSDSEKRFRLLAENARDVIFLYSFAQHRHEYLSPSVYNLTGHLPEEFYINPRLFNSLVHPDDLDLVEAIGPDIEKGQLRPVLEFRIRHRNGNIIWINQRHSVTLDKSGTPVSLEGICTDVSAFRQKAMEKVELEKQLFHSQKTEAIGRLAGGIAHDFNNLLTVIHGYTDLLLDNPKCQEGIEELEQIRKAGLKASDLTSQLLSFSRRQSANPKDIDLQEVVFDSFKMICRVVSETIEITCEVDPGLPNIHFDPNQLDQIIVNLVLNAKDALDGPGHIHIQVSKEDLSGQQCPKCKIDLLGEFIVLSVTDDGCGISPENLNRVFDPFFTTKTVGEGTGLGLSSVYGLVHPQGGHVQISSQVGQGTTMRVLLPFEHAHDHPVPEDPNSLDSIQGAGETILLVEDEDLVRHLASTILTHLGYQVLEAQNGQEALELISRQSTGPDGEVDLVLTDVVMPVMGGTELAIQLTREKPDLKIIFMTGYQDKMLDSELTGGKEIFLLKKPFGAEELGRSIKQILYPSS